LESGFKTGPNPLGSGEKTFPDCIDQNSTHIHVFGQRLTLFRNSFRVCSFARRQDDTPSSLVDQPTHDGFSPVRNIRDSISRTDWNGCPKIKTSPFASLHFLQ
jgi:hypothetical protein